MVGTFEHPKRRLLAEAVRRNPGISYNELVARAGMASGTARHHLRILVGKGLVQVRAIGNTLRHYPSKTDPAQHQRLALLQDARLAHLLALVGERPGIRQADLLGLSAGGRTSTQARLGKLLAAGLIASRRQGREMTYVAIPDPCEDRSRARPPL